MIRFTIRDVLWLTALVALAFGWFVDHRLQQRQIEKERAASIEAAAQVQIEWLKRYRGESDDGNLRFTLLRDLSNSP